MDRLGTFYDIITTLFDSSEIGTYTFTNGQSTEAIIHLPVPDFGYEYPPDEVKVTGIEYKLVEHAPAKYPLINQGITKPRRYSVCLQHWSDSFDLFNLADRLEDYYLATGYKILENGLLPPIEDKGIKSSYMIELLDLRVEIWDATNNH